MTTAFLSNPLVHFNQISQRWIDISGMTIPCTADQGEGLHRGETPTTAPTGGRTGSQRVEEEKKPQR